VLRRVLLDGIVDDEGQVGEQATACGLG
jgi:hypothetical protein